MQGVSRLPNSTLFVVEPGYLGLFLAHNIDNIMRSVSFRNLKDVANFCFLCNLFSFQNSSRRKLGSRNRQSI